MLETRFGDDPLAGLKDSTSPGNLTVTFGSKLINKSKLKNTKNYLLIFLQLSRHLTSS